MKEEYLESGGCSNCLWLGAWYEVEDNINKCSKHPNCYYTPCQSDSNEDDSHKGIHFALSKPTDTP